MDNYLKQVIEQVQKETGYNLLTTGMEVYTNVNRAVQERLWNIYNSNEYVAYPDNELQVASTIMDVTNGKVIAQLGARNQTSNVSFGTNQAVETNRDWGSTMKPITDYAPAIENGVYTSTAAYISDTPYHYPGTTTPVYNWDMRYFGNITIQYSSNTTKSDKKYGASSEKMAAAYAAFANGGTYYKPQYVSRVVFSDGTSKNFANQGTTAMKETTAYMMTNMLKTVLTSGTGTNAAISGVYQAGKTGTSNYSDDELAKLTKPYGGSSVVTPDELFVGYTQKYSMAVWTGYTNRLTPVLDDGVKVATDVYRAMMSYLSESGTEDWEMPSGLYRSGNYVFLANSTNRYQGNYYNSTSSSSLEESSSSSSSQESSTQESSSSSASSSTEPSASTSASSPNSGGNSETPPSRNR